MSNLPILISVVAKRIRKIEKDVVPFHKMIFFWMLLFISVITVIRIYY